MKNLLLLLLFSSLMLSVTYAQGYKIEVKIKGVENQELILGHHKNSNLIPNDTVSTNSKGYAVFEGNESLHQGMYFIFLPTSTYFDFIIGDDQTFAIENDTSDLFLNFKTKGSSELEIFVDYHSFLVEQNERIYTLREDHKKETNEAKKTQIEDELNTISDAFESYYDKITTKYPDMFFTAFLKASRDVSVPETITERTAQYYYYKNHYFENFDVSDSRLLYTPLYENKIDTYLDRVVLQDPDTLIEAIDYLLKETEHDESLYQYMLIHLFNKYATSQMMVAENLFVHLGEVYIEKATWSADSFKNELQTKIVRKKNCLLGKNAPQIKMTFLPSDSLGIERLRAPLEIMKQHGLEIENDTSRTFEEKVPDLSQQIAEYMSFFSKDQQLYDVKAKYTILWFMSPDCSHCKTETPLFYKKYVEVLRELDVEVWCVYMEKNTDNWNKFSNSLKEWMNFVQKHKLYDWKNVWNPFANYRFKYDLNSSPILFLLDENKKIIAKRIGYLQATDYILHLEGQKNN